MKKVTVRQAEVIKRNLILNSAAFKSWKENRQAQGNPPADYYRAYMIDSGLRAQKAKHLGEWKHKVNRLDMGQIDSPRLGYAEYPVFAPAPKTREATKRSQIRRQIKSEGPKPSATQLKIHRLIESSAASYGLPAPDIHVVPRASTANESSSMEPFWNPINKRITGGRITIFAGKSEGNTIATTAHEVGHYIHGAADPASLKEKHGINVVYRPKSQRGGNLGPTSIAGRAETFRTEKAATKIGKSLAGFKALPKIEQARGSWRLRYALETYAREAHAEGTQSNYKVVFGKPKFPPELGKD